MQILHARNWIRYEENLMEKNSEDLLIAIKSFLLLLPFYLLIAILCIQGWHWIQDGIWIDFPLKDVPCYFEGNSECKFVADTELVGLNKIINWFYGIAVTWYLFVLELIILMITFSD